MDFKIDWIAFTIPLDGIVSSCTPAAQDFILSKYREFLGSAWEPIAAGHGWEINQGRGFYQWVLYNPNTKAALQWGDVNAHIHVELSGQTCRFIDTFSTCENLLQVVGTRTSRVDVACDIKCDLKPLEFTVNNEGKSFKAGGHIFSADGETAYVGSRKGERFARVYRYHNPHPRSQFLRVEVVMKSTYAKAFCERVSREGLLPAALAANKPYGWKHPVWNSDLATVAKITAPRSSIGEASTIRWLVDVVAPSIAKACRENLITLDEFVEKHIKPKM